MAAKYFGAPLARLSNRKIDSKALNLITEDIARQKRIVAFSFEQDGRVSVGMEDPTDLLITQFLESYLKTKVKPYFASEDDLNKGFSLYSQATAENFKNIIEENIKVSLQKKAIGEKSASEMPIVAIVDNLISYAMAMGASDIHMEVFSDTILVRYRIDGILREVLQIPRQVHPAIIARIKLLAGLKIDEHSKPQDGRFRYKIGEDMVDLRVSIIPTFYGEKIEMRLLPATVRPLSFAELGMLSDTRNVINKNIKRSYGMLLSSGPTGSGKTTTLYSILSKLNHPDVNIVTIEDPIEYDIKFINQIQVNNAAGITFANGLRSILRQDPNIIMVGEIRDEETAEIAVQASLTGHLVLSSLHTNDSPTAIPRLIDMGIEPFLIAAVLDVVLAQRLTRRIHLDCIESYHIDEETIRAIKKQLKIIGVEEAEMEGKIPRTLYRGTGCAADNFTGYSGRVGIFETLDISDEIRKIIVSPNFSIDLIKKQARKEGMITMFEDGLRKVERGITTIDEVLRVIQE